MDQPIVTPSLPMLFDLGSDPQERFNLMSDRMDMDFMVDALKKPAVEYILSTVEYPNIEPGVVGFTGYHGPEHEANRKKAQAAMKKIAGAAKPDMGEAPETPAEATGRQKVGARDGNS
jgi:hypothetical protein